jgi:hypothetical protein
MIVLGLAIAAAGLIVAIRAGWRLYKMGRRVQRDIEVEVQAIMVRQEQVLERMSSIEQKQQVLTGRLERLKGATGRLGFVLGQLSDARARITRVP